MRTVLRLSDNGGNEGFDAGLFEEELIGFVHSVVDGAMNQSYAPQRKQLLSLEHEASQPIEGVLIQRPQSGIDARRQGALSSPETARALSEPLGPFFEACGGRTVLSLSVERKDRKAPPKTYVFEQPFVLIGRSPDGDLTLSDPTIGFRHIYLQLIEGRWSFVNLARVARVASAAGDERTSGWFDPGDVLRAGPYAIRRLTPPAETIDRDAITIAPTPVGIKPVHLEMINGLSESRKSRDRTLTSAITLIGASRQCELWLRDDSVSGVHAGLVLTPHGVWIVDLLGREGILVDEQRVYWKQIHDGDELQIGRFRFRVRTGEETRRKSRRNTKRSKGKSSGAGAVDPVSGGNLTGDSVLALFRQLAEMQSQFFEHSQLQMQLMSEMVAHLRGSQQATVRRDLARIDEIGRELREIQVQLAGSPASAQANPAMETPPVSPPALIDESPEALASGDVHRVMQPMTLFPELETSPLNEAPIDAEPDEQEAETSPMVDSADAEISDPEAPAHSGHARHPFPLSNESIRREPLGTPPDDAHARLTRRMAKLSQERNSRWRQVLQAFKRKSND